MTNAGGLVEDRVFLISSLRGGGCGLGAIFGEVFKSLDVLIYREVVVTALTGVCFLFGSFLSFEEIESELEEGVILDGESKLPGLIDILGCCEASFALVRIPFGDLGWSGEDGAGEINWISGSTGVAHLFDSARPIGLAGFVSDRFALVFGLVGEEVGVEVLIEFVG